MHTVLLLSSLIHLSCYSISLCCQYLHIRLSEYTIHFLGAFHAQFFADLIQATQDQTNVNVPQMADTLIERAGNASWVVVFKALITTHHLMVHGNEVSIDIYSQPHDVLRFSLYCSHT